MKSFLRAGEGGLEVRGDGAGSLVPLDLHSGGSGGHRGHHPASAHSLRRSGADRQKVQRIRDHDGSEVSAPVVHARALHRRERLRTSSLDLVLGVSANSASLSSMTKLRQKGSDFAKSDRKYTTGDFKDDEWDAKLLRERDENRKSEIDVVCLRRQCRR